MQFMTVRNIHYSKASDGSTCKIKSPRADEKQDEYAQSPLSNAIIEQRAVMVKSDDTVVAGAAMIRFWQSLDFAGGALPVVVKP